MIGVNEEIRKRIKVAVAAWSYEKHNVSIMSDHEFDALCLEINPSISTGNKKVDRFFREVFEPHTGSWVHYHPNKKGLENVYHRYYREEYGGQDE